MDATEIAREIEGTGAYRRARIEGCSTAKALERAAEIHSELGLAEMSDDDLDAILCELN